VRSEIVRLDQRRGDRPPRAVRERCYALTRRAFAQRRKQMATILGHILKGGEPGRIAERLATAGIDKAARPEDLSTDDWLRLSEALPPEQAAENGERWRTDMTKEEQACT
jgi:16S rRNA A1518/A1519 N6-dimethyltransferase RsmA/KsgA/DIM1 with predicted DNA glycosylase/AP lyase activity